MLTLFTTAVAAEELVMNCDEYIYKYIQDPAGDKIIWKHKKWTKNKDYKISDSLLMLESLPARETRNYIKLVLTNLWIYKLRFNQKSNILSALAAGKPINFKVFFKH